MSRVTTIFLGIQFTKNVKITIVTEGKLSIKNQWKPIRTLRGKVMIIYPKMKPHTAPDLHSGDFIHQSRRSSGAV